MVFDLIVSALITVLVVTLTDGILTFFGNGLMNIGYRSAWIGPGGLRPSVRTDDSDGGCAAFVLPDLLFPDARNHPIHWEDSGKGKGDISRGF